MNATTLDAAAHRAVPVSVQAMSPDDPFLSFPRAAQVAGKTTKTLRKEIANGRLRAVRVGSGNGRIHIRMSWLLEYLLARPA